MNEKIKSLLVSMRYHLNSGHPSDERVSVDRGELDTLVTYMETRAAEDALEAEGLAVGDRVESLEDVPTLHGPVPAGTKGVLYKISDDNGGRIYPFSVETDTGLKVAYQHHEIRKAR